jgi:hypothetical protein
MEGSIDGPVSFNHLPSRWNLSVNSGINGYTRRVDLRSDGTNMLRSYKVSGQPLNTLTPTLQLVKENVGAPGVGTGIDIQTWVQTQNNGGNSILVGNIQYLTTDLTGGAEQLDVVFTELVAGSVVEVMRFIRGVVKFAVKTVATLPSAATAGVGARSFVTDSVGAVWGTTVVGGGSNKLPVFCDGSNWLVG